MKLQEPEISLFIQFDDDEPIEAMTCCGKDFILKLHDDGGQVDFTDTNTGKKFKMYVKKSHERPTNEKNRG